MKYGAPFTEREDAYLREHYKTMTSHAIAAKLKRPYAGIENRRRILGLLKRADAKAKPIQAKTTVCFDNDLMHRIRMHAKLSALSMSAYVQEIVRLHLDGGVSKR